MSPRGHLWARGNLAIAGLALSGMLAITAPAGATTLRKMDLPELVDAAERIVHARAVTSSVYWDPTETQIYTDTTFDVVSEAKGAGSSTLTVTLLGGTIGDVEMRAEGGPIFSLGEEVVLFTVSRPDGNNDLVGYTQGVMRVVVEDAGDKIAVSEVPLGINLVQLGGPAPMPVRPSPMRAPLGVLVEEIRQMVLNGQPAGPVISKTPETDPVAPGDEIQ